MSQIDWLARRSGGIVDFRLPSDGFDIPGSVMRTRIAEYYQQLWAASGQKAPNHADHSNRDRAATTGNSVVHPRNTKSRARPGLRRPNEPTTGTDGDPGPWDFYAND
jgi:hypothetical protein